MATGGEFEVFLPDLRTGATRLGVDSEDVVRAGAAGVAAAELGAAACVGPLAAALTRFADQITSFAAVMATATQDAGTTLSGNAVQYEGDDTNAQTRLDAVVPTTGPTPSPSGPGGGR